MPLSPGADVGETIREFRTGKRYAKQKRKKGKKAADKMALAVALRNRRARIKKAARRYSRRMVKR